LITIKFATLNIFEETLIIYIFYIYIKFY